MSEKRFVIGDDNIAMFEVIDMEKEELVCECRAVDVEKMVDLLNELATKCSRLAKEKDELSDEIGQLNNAWADKVSRLLDFVEEQGQVSRQQIKEWWNDE